MKKHYYKDSLHGFIAHSSTTNGAWMLIRAKCRDLKIEVPTIDKIKLVPNTFIMNKSTVNSQKSTVNK